MIHSNSPRRAFGVGTVLLAGAILIGCDQGSADMVVRPDDNKPMDTISQIMKKVHGRESNLAKKLLLGQITDPEKVKLIEYYEALGKATPPKGTAEDWQKRTSKLLAAAKAALNGGQPEKVQFRQAVDCKSCHDAHKTTDN
jgi:hypothetical protein